MIRGGATDAQKEYLKETIFAQGVSPELILGVLAVFLKAAVAAGVAVHRICLNP